MKPSDAIDLVALVVERWPSSRLGLEQQRRYAEDLAQLDPEHARAALDAIHRDGGDFAPTAGDVIRRGAALELGAPDWSEVKRQLIERRVARARFDPPPWECPFGECDGSGFREIAERKTADCRCRPDRRASRRMIDTLHPLVREFIDAAYVTWAEVEEIGAGVNTTLEAQMRTKWETFAGRAVESRVLATIGAAPDLARLEQAREEDAPRPRRERRDQLGRPDYVAALPAPSQA